MTDPRSPDRRRVLKALGAASVVGAVAGCVNNGDDPGNNTSNEPGGDGSDPESAGGRFETEVDRTIPSEGIEPSFELEAGSEIRLTVEDTESTAIVYVSSRMGDVLVNDSTESSDTWEIPIESDGEYFVEVYTDNGEASVTIEVAPAPADDDSSDSSSEEEEGGSDPAACDGLGEGEYSRHDEADSPFVATFEHPGTVSVSGRTNNDYSLTITVGSAQNPVYVFPTQDVAGTESPTDIQQGMGEGVEIAFEIDFNGETVRVVRVSPEAADPTGTAYYREYPYYVAGLPHEGSNGKRYYRFSAKGSVQFASDLEAPDCADAIDEMTRRMMESLEPNSDTTVEDVGV